MTRERSFTLRATAFAMAGNLACIWLPMMFDLIEVSFGGGRLSNSRFGPLLGLVAPVGWLIWAFWSIGRSRSNRIRETFAWGVSLFFFGLWSLLWFPDAAGSQQEFTRFHSEMRQVINSNEPLPAWQFYELLARTWLCYGIPSGLGMSTYGLARSCFEGAGKQDSISVPSSPLP